MRKIKTFFIDFMEREPPVGISARVRNPQGRYPAKVPNTFLVTKLKLRDSCLCLTFNRIQKFCMNRAFVYRAIKT